MSETQCLKCANRKLKKRHKELMDNLQALNDVLVNHTNHVRIFQAEVRAQYIRLENKIMALTDQQQAAVAKILALLTSISADADASLSAAIAMSKTFQTRIDELEALKVTLTEQLGAKDKQVLALGDTITSLTADKTTHDDEILAVLQSISNSAGGVDEHVKGLGNGGGTNGGTNGGGSTPPDDGTLHSSVNVGGANTAV